MATSIDSGFMQMDDNIVPDVEVGCTEQPVAADPNVNIVNSINDSRNIHCGSNWCTSIRAQLGMDNSWESLRDDPCPLYFVALLTLIYFPIGLIVMPITCCGFKLDPNLQPRKITAYKCMMIATLLRILFQLVIVWVWGVDYSIYGAIGLYPFLK
eukprot:66149_1